MTGHGIVAESVSKKFRRGELHDSLRDLVPALVRRIVGRGPARDRLNEGEFWAVRNVSFEVKPGEALGIIGPNGAGKSTILKLLTKILLPNSGHIHVSGRIGALIEIAAGFHGDLTGRENIFLQGAIMGMKRREIRDRFDQIVEFSDVAEFLDTPVKRYSSGMISRLGFSIAAHLEPDVLIIDEILAVGDHAFQAKAFERIRQLVTNSGTPVVVVSHQLDRVSAICRRALLLERGIVRCEGTPAECIAAYLDDRGPADGPGTEDAAPLVIHAAAAGSRGPVPSGGPLDIRITASIRDEEAARQCAIGVRLRDVRTGQVVYVADTSDGGLTLPRRGRFRVDIGLRLNVPPGLYAAEIIVRNVIRKRAVGQGPVVTIHVADGPPFWGSVQLNAQMALSALEDATAVADVAARRC